MTKTFGMVAKTLYGLEEVLAKELIDLGADGVQIGRRMVSFEGDLALMYRANFCCRTALRILKPIREFKAKSAEEVYEQVKRISWEQYLSSTTTFAVDSVVNSDDFNHSKFVAYKVKDAIVDYFTERDEERPSVRINNPDIQLHLHISHNDCTLALDSSGESLHKRGYRVDQTEAPLNEVLAAGIIMQTAWQGDTDFIDPMCGSGTLLIEAAMIALNIAPGVYRETFAFEKWPDFSKDLLEEIYNDDSRERPFTHKIFGADVSPLAIDIARANVKNAGLSGYIDLSVKPIQKWIKREVPGVVVTNPPYGERLNTADLLGLYQVIGERMKHAFVGHQVWVLSYKEECFDNIGLKHTSRLKLKNGALDCELRKYDIFTGKRKDLERDKSPHLSSGKDRPASFKSDRTASSKLDRSAFTKSDRVFSNRPEKRTLLKSEKPVFPKSEKPSGVGKQVVLKKSTLPKEQPATPRISPTKASKLPNRYKDIQELRRKLDENKDE